LGQEILKFERIEAVSDARANRRLVARIVG
jgi:hypothetical protein